MRVTTYAEQVAMYGEPWPALRELGLTGWITCHWAPFQVEVIVEGGWAYFRARGGVRSVGFSTLSDDDAVGAGFDPPIPGQRHGIRGEDTAGLSGGWDEIADTDFARHVADDVRLTVYLYLNALPTPQPRPTP